MMSSAPIVKPPHAPRPIHLRRLPALALFGATVGAALDEMHTRSGTIAYPADASPYRGILTFSIAYGVGGLIYAAAMRRAVPSQEPKPLTDTWPSVVVYAGMYALTSVSDNRIPSPVVCGVIAAASLYYWRRFDGSAAGAAVGVVPGLLGAAFESMYSRNGVMAYATQDVGMVPIWLPALYVLWSATYGQVCRRVLTA
jgi:hypothetical protein